MSIKHFSCPMFEKGLDDKIIAIQNAVKEHL